MQTIKLSNSEKFALVDDEDFQKWGHYTWHSNADGYACRNTKIPGTRQNRAYFLHRLIMGAQHGDGKIVDHINRDRLDCRKSNLRFVTHGESAMNSGKRKTSKSGFKGVYPHSYYPGKPWIVQVQHQRKLYYLGCYADKIEAAKVYDAKAKELFGEFAVLNFP